MASPPQGHHPADRSSSPFDIKAFLQSSSAGPSSPSSNRNNGPAWSHSSPPRRGYEMPGGDGMEVDEQEVKPVFGVRGAVGGSMGMGMGQYRQGQGQQQEYHPTHAQAQTQFIQVPQLGQANYHVPQAPLPRAIPSDQSQFPFGNGGSLAPHRANAPSFTFGGPSNGTPIQVPGGPWAFEPFTGSGGSGSKGMKQTKVLTPFEVKAGRKEIEERMRKMKVGKMEISQTLVAQPAAKVQRKAVGQDVGSSKCGVCRPGKTMCLPCVSRMWTGNDSYRRKNDRVTKSAADYRKERDTAIHQRDKIMKERDLLQSRLDVLQASPPAAKDVPVPRKDIPISIAKMLSDDSPAKPTIFACWRLEEVGNGEVVGYVEKVVGKCMFEGVRVGQLCVGCYQSMTSEEMIHHLDPNAPSSSNNVCRVVLALSEAYDESDTWLTKINLYFDPKTWLVDGKRLERRSNPGKGLVPYDEITQFRRYFEMDEKGEVEEKDEEDEEMSDF